MNFILLGPWAEKKTLAGTALGELWESSGRSMENLFLQKCFSKGSGTALGELWESSGRALGEL